MANGYAAAFAVTVEKEDIMKQGFNSLTDLESLLTNNGESIESFAVITEHIALNYGENTLTDKQIKEIQSEFDMDEEVLRHALILYALFRNHFHEKYNLDIMLEYHDEEKGDIYDDISGAYFALHFGDAFQLSKEVQAMKKDIPFELSQFVVYG